MSDNWNGVEGAQGKHEPMPPHLSGAWCYPEEILCWPDDLCACCHIALGHRQVWLDKEGKEVAAAIGIIQKGGCP